MYAPDGTTITRNSQSDSFRAFVDFDSNRMQRIGANDIDYRGMPEVAAADFNGGYFLQLGPGDEPYVNIVPFLAVFDDDEARELFGDDDWQGVTRELELTQYISQHADRIHFNRYSGVAMK